jgi:hypothetical protein
VIFFTGGGSWVFKFATAFLAAEPPPTQFSFNDQRDASLSQEQREVISADLALLFDRRITSLLSASSYLRGFAPFAC